jgi:hypothetical protein
MSANGLAKTEVTTFWAFSGVISAEKRNFSRCQAGTETAEYAGLQFGCSHF